MQQFVSELVYRLFTIGMAINAFRNVYAAGYIYVINALRIDFCFGSIFPKRDGLAKHLFTLRKSVEINKQKLLENFEKFQIYWEARLVT